MLLLLSLQTERHMVLRRLQPQTVYFLDDSVEHVCAGRDKKGMLFQLLLPLAAICLVMAILKININPTSPSIVLNLADLLQQDPVIAASPPQYMAPCIVESKAASVGAACTGGLHFRCAPPRALIAASLVAVMVAFIASQSS